MARLQGKYGMTPELSGAQKAALFLLSLQESDTTEIFRHLEPQEIKRIMDAMSTLTNVSGEAVGKVFERFADYVENEPMMLEGGEHYLRGALNRALGPLEARRVMGELDDRPSPAAMQLSSVDPRMLSNVLEVEHPQTIALLMTRMEPKQAASVLAHLPEGTQDQVMQRVARLERVSPEVVREIENSIIAELQALGTPEQEAFQGREQAAALLNNMERGIGAEMLARLEDMDEELAEGIRAKMFMFEDLMGVDDRGVQAILKEISSDVLIISLKTASSDLRDKFFRNMSSRAADMMKDDLAAMGPVRVSDVEAAQKEIAQIALRLQEEGTIVIAGAGEDVV
jgi:flagellar motor switch protein FliG